MSTQFNLEKTLVITGPTASGKSGLAIEIARKHNGEIISADSRQIYRGMNLGTGKVTPEEQSLIKHHLIDICDPSENYNVTDFKRDARQLVDEIKSRGKLPIICGGTGFWIQALVDNQSFPEVPPNQELREELSKYSTEALFAKLQSLDPDRAKTVDAKNAVRLIRAIEIARALGKVPPMETVSEDNNFNITALNPPKEILASKIKKRLNERFDQGMLEEVRHLHTQGVSWERLESFGLEYKWIALFLQAQIDEKTMKEKLYFDIIHYAKRQLTWLRRWEKQGAKIYWVSEPSLQEITQLTEKS